MKGTSLTVDDLLGHMTEACRKITNYTDGMDEQSFYRSQITIDAVVKNIEVLGEAANSLIKNFPIFTENEPHIPWRQLYGMRNRLTHGYFDIDSQIVWKTVKADIPQLIQALSAIEKKHLGTVAAAHKRTRDHGR